MYIHTYIHTNTHGSSFSNTVVVATMLRRHSLGRNRSTFRKRAHCRNRFQARMIYIYKCTPHFEPLRTGSILYDQGNFPHLYKHTYIHICMHKYIQRFTEWAWINMPWLALRTEPARSQEPWARPAFSPEQAGSSRGQIILRSVDAETKTNIFSVFGMRILSCILRLGLD